jgi:hypothetical protein
MESGLAGEILCREDPENVLNQLPEVGPSLLNITEESRCFGDKANFRGLSPDFPNFLCLIPSLYRPSIQKGPGIVAIQGEKLMGKGPKPPGTRRPARFSQVPRVGV